MALWKDCPENQWKNGARQRLRIRCATYLRSRIYGKQQFFHFHLNNLRFYWKFSWLKYG